MTVNGDDNTERLLVQQCLSGDEQAWKTLVDKHFRLIASIVRWQKWRFDQRDVEDVVQDALEELVKSLAGFQFQSRLSSFVRTIAVRACTDRIRKKVAQKRISDMDCVPLDSGGDDEDDSRSPIPTDQGPNQEEMLLTRERLGALRQALGLLDKECKKLIRMRFFDDLSFPEMADALRIKANTVAVQVRRCVFKIHRLFPKQG
ncbi:MAG: sigma-70 family RNA polymerase sigma factor [Thermodesulfobacteriota bacterium]